MLNPKNTCASNGPLSRGKNRTLPIHLLGLVCAYVVAFVLITGIHHAGAATIPAGPGATDTVVRTDGSAAYVLGSGSSTITVVDPATNAVLYTIPLTGLPPGAAVDMDWNEVAQRLVVGCNTGQILSVDPATTLVVMLVNLPGNNYSQVCAENWTTPNTFAWALDSSTGWLHQITNGGTVNPVAAVPVGASVELVEKAWDPANPTIMDGYLLAVGTSAGYATVDVIDRATFLSSPLMMWTTVGATATGISAGLGAEAFVTANAGGGTPAFLLRVDLTMMAFTPGPIATDPLDSFLDVAVNGQWVSVLSTDNLGGGSKIHVFDNGDPTNVLHAGHLPVAGPATPAGGLGTWLAPHGTIDDLYAAFVNQGQDAEGNQFGESKDGFIDAAPSAVTSSLFPVTTPSEVGALAQEALICTECPPREGGGRGKLAGIPGGVQIAYSGSERSVQYATGEEIFVQPVMSVPGVGLDVEISLTYRSRRDFNYRYGQGWFLNQDVRMRTEPNGDRTYQSPYGRMDTYSLQPGGYYISPPHYDTTLNTTGTTTVTNRFGKVLTFDANGYRISEADRYGNTIQYTYTADKLTQITDTLGRNYTLSYDGTGRLSSVVDFGGRTWTMSYDYLGQLRYVQTPSSAQFPQGRKHWFSYSGNSVQPGFRSNQVHVWSPKGDRIQTLAYGPFDRVTAETIGDASYQFSYDVSTQSTTVVDRSGNTSKWTFGSMGVLNRLERFTKGLRIGEPASFVTTYGVAPNGMVTSVVHAGGNRTDMTYDSALNLTEVRRRETNTTTNSSTDIVWSYQYTGPYNQISQITDPRGNTSSFTIDGMGNTTQVTRPTVSNPATQVITEQFTHDLQGRLLTATDGNGKSVALSYHPAGPQAGYLRDVTRDPGGLAIKTQFSYDQFGHLTSVTDPRGNTTSFALDTEGFTTEVTAAAPFGFRRRVTYDANRNVSLVETENVDRKGVQDATTPWIGTSYTYDPLGRLTSVTTPLSATESATTNYEYDGTGLLIAVVHPEGNRDEIEYDERLLVFRATRGAGTSEAATIRNDYDANGRMVTSTDARGNSTTFAYDSHGRKTRQTDALGHYVDFTYDKGGNVTSVAAYDTSSALLAKSERYYDVLGRLWKEVAHRFGPTLVTTYPTTTITRDKASRITSIVDALGNALTLTHDAAGRLSTRTDAAGNKVTLTYDANGNVTKVDSLEVPTSGPSETHTTEYTYDVLNRLTDVNEVDRLNTSNKLTTQLEYDSRGNLTFRTDAEGSPARWTYDLADRLIQYERALQVGAQIDIFTQSLDEAFAYDKNNRLTTATDDNFNSTAYLYDALDRPTKLTYADGKFATLVYDKNGNPTSQTDQNGSVVTSTYDVLDRLVSKSIALGTGVLGTTSETYTHDGLGRVLTAVDNDYQVEFTWDSLGNLLSERQGYTTVGQEKWKTVSTSYNDVGAPAGVNYPGGLSIAHTRDSIYRTTAIFDVGASANVATFTWQGASRLASTTNQNGTSTDYVYDGFRRTVSIDHTLGSGASLHKFEYAYDRVHNRRMEKSSFTASWVSTLPAAVQTFLNGRNGKGDVYAYDMAHRLVDARYDVSNPLTEVQSPGSQTFASMVSYTIDGLGNRSQVQTTVPPAPPTTVTYAANIVNQYTAIGGTPRTHDSNGNLSDDGTHLYDYDYTNKVVRVRLKSGGATVATYKYDAIGRRVEKAVTGGSTTRYVLQGQQVVEEYDGSNSWTASYVYEDGIDSPRAMDRTDVSDADGDGNTTEVLRFHFHQNALGSTTELTEPGGTVVEWVTYDVYGAPTLRSKSGGVISQSAIGNPYLFTGREFDAECAKYHYRARTYDPVSGRFLQRDPLGYADGMNAYEYVRSSPASLVDPLGLESRDAKAALKKYRAKKRAYFAAMMAYYRAQDEAKKAQALVDRLKKQLEKHSRRWNRCSPGKKNVWQRALEKAIAEAEAILAALQAREASAKAAYEAAKKEMNEAWREYREIRDAEDEEIPDPAGEIAEAIKDGLIDAAAGVTEAVADLLDGDPTPGIGDLKNVVADGLRWGAERAGSGGTVQQVTRVGYHVAFAIGTAGAGVSGARSVAAQTARSSRGAGISGQISGEFATARGPLEWIANASSRGRTLTLNDFAIFPAGANTLPVGTRGMLEAIRATGATFRSLGYDTVHVMGTRLTGASVGRAVDRVIRLR